MLCDVICCVGRPRKRTDVVTMHYYSILKHVLKYSYSWPLHGLCCAAQAQLMAALLDSAFASAPGTSTGAGAAKQPQNALRRQMLAETLMAQVRRPHASMHARSLLVIIIIRCEAAHSFMSCPGAGP